MIRLGPFLSPELLRDDYVIASRQRLRDYLRRSPAERAQRRAEIDELFYFWEPVRTAVEARCLNKCVFCERGAPLVETMVETFRPRRNAGDVFGEIANDHYIWLAYEFDNLVLVCTECSSRKRSEFPLLGARAPYLTPMSEIRTRERPLIVDPFRGNPERHFLFFSDGRCAGATQEGRITTRLLGLDNHGLEKQRADEMETLVAHLQASIEGSGPSPLQYLAQNLRFAGARIGFTRRLFDGVEIGGARLNGWSSTFVQQLASVLRDVSASDQDRLFRRIDAVIGNDRVRRRPDPEAPLLPIHSTSRIPP